MPITTLISGSPAKLVTASGFSNENSQSGGSGMAESGGEKYVFISDLHLGDQNSYQPAQPGTFPYGWTNRHVKELEKFLGELDDHAATHGAEKVMIVGDLADTWVCPSVLNPPSFDGVIKIFGDIFDQWDRKSGSGIPATMAAAGDGGLLRPAADFKYFLPGTAKIVLFGHTHNYEIKSGLLDTADPGAVANDPSRASVVYGNCGAWIDAKKCTFIVTERCTINGEDRIYVRGYEYCLPEPKEPGIIKGPLDETYVVV